MISFTIITPSLQRESLIKCCRSMESQSYPHWQHVVALDCAPEDIKHDLMEQIQHPQREIFCCGQKFGNFGNHARWMAWERATGDYLWGVDDDNIVAHDDALKDIASALESANSPAWALFVILRYGERYLHNPPVFCGTDTMNMVIRREIGRWLDIEAKEADGYLAMELKDKYPYVAFPNVKPIGNMDYSSNGGG